MRLLAIALAGTLGVLARFLIQTAVPRPSGLPLGTFIVNISGALAIGLVASLVVHRFHAPMWLQEAATVGFLGGFTTFSALALDTVLLIDRGRFLAAAGYSLGTMAAGTFAVVVGLRLGRLT